jgi:hypothetical protein
MVPGEHLEPHGVTVYPCIPRSRGLSERGVFSCEACCIPAHMQGWRYQLEEDFGKKCPRWVVTRDSAWRCEHDGCNIAVFKRTLLSILHAPIERKSLVGHKNRLVQPDSLNVGCITEGRGLVDAQPLSKSLSHLRNAGRCWRGSGPRPYPRGVLDAAG